MGLGDKALPLNVSSVAYCVGCFVEVIYVHLMGVP